ncbi:head-tail connector protein [Lentibacillus salicampi]|uniref:Phage gp6-like head-tail connector protein n=1 Tax=Lentibacillus salicampi TaxID=175306 RepID=A0A4Y9ACP3_9BACI|nr:head-tail connector protein [Lentibacillus salicampi]TFJ92141.1 phage gp6-like head-tail connector protein [Lentibacillus salicampi]
MHLKVITEATESAVSVDTVKDYLRIDYSDEDMLIQSMIGASVSHVETFIRRSLAPKTYELTCEVSGLIKLPNPPVTSIEKVTIGGHAINDYMRVPSEPNVLEIPCDDKNLTLEVQYIAGYNKLPKPIEQAVLLLISHFYENREAVIVGTSVVKMPFSVEALLYPYKGWF